MNMLLQCYDARKSALWFLIHRAMKEYYCFCFPPRILTEKWVAVHLICQGDQVHLPLFPPPSFPPSLPPPLSTLIGRDSHHMCKGKVMGGMAALISERLPADKPNGCGEAWASALLRNKHFHFVWLEWRMERWKWWIDDLRIWGGRGERDRWNGWGCYSILTDQSEGGEICILSTIYPHLAEEATLRSYDSTGCCAMLKYKILTAYSRRFVSQYWIYIASNNNNPVSYIRKMNIYIHDFKLWWLHDNHFWIAVRIHDEQCTIASVCSIWWRKSNILIKLYFATR